MALLKKLKEFDKENIEEKIIMSLKVFLEDPKNKEFLVPETVEKASPVCYAMLQWIKALYGFYFINKRVKPKKAKLAEAVIKEKLQKDTLAVKQADLKEATDKVQVLIDKLTLNKDNKDRLDAKYASCKV